MWIRVLSTSMSNIDRSRSGTSTDDALFPE